MEYLQGGTVHCDQEIADNLTVKKVSFRDRVNIEMEVQMMLIKKHGFLLHLSSSDHVDNSSLIVRSSSLPPKKWKITCDLDSVPVNLKKFNHDSSDANFLPPTNYRISEQSVCTSTLKCVNGPDSGFESDEPIKDQKSLDTVIPAEKTSYVAMKENDAFEGVSVNEYSEVVEDQSRYTDSNIKVKDESVKSFTSPDLKSECSRKTIKCTVPPKKPRAFIDHGTESFVNDTSIIAKKMPVIDLTTAENDKSELEFNKDSVYSLRKRTKSKNVIGQKNVASVSNTKKKRSVSGGIKKSSNTDKVRASKKSKVVEVAIPSTSNGASKAIVAKIEPELVSIVMAYNPNMARKFSSIQRTPEEQAKRDKNTAAARICRTRAKYWKLDVKNEN